VSVAKSLFAELAYPLRSATTLVTLVSFLLLYLLANAAGLLGLWLLLVVLAALTQYLMHVLEARARDEEPSTPGIEMFSWVSSAWALFPLLPILMIVAGVRFLADEVAPVAAIVAGAAAIGVMPASLAVLAISHSPLQSVSPVRVARLIYRCKTTYWLAPLVVLAAILLRAAVSGLPVWLLSALELYLLFTVFAVIGAVLRPHGIADDIDVVDEQLPGVEFDRKRLARDRNNALDVAYGFASRGNRDGALGHLYDWLAADPEPAVAWPFFLDSLLQWEDKYPALLLAQQYLGRLLEHGQAIAAVKLMLRCRMVDPGFRPLAPDLPAAVEAAKHCRNEELVAALEAYR